MTTLKFKLYRRLIEALLSWIICINATAQNNTSYSSNTIPINGSFSIGLGLETLTNNNGFSNTAVGHRSLRFNTTGRNNIAIGSNALFNNVDGNGLVAIGDSALFNQNGGMGYNTAIGYKSLFSNTYGMANTAIGYGSLQSNTMGIANTANGVEALYYNTYGNGNTANGSSAIFYNTTGNFNTANGYLTLFSNTSGSNNTANGYVSLYWNTTGINNTSNGMGSLRFNSTGSNNTANGAFVLWKNTTGNNNTALGDSAGYHSLGSGNIYIGHKAGALETGNNKLYIGNNENKSILYGDISTGQVLLGKPDATGYAFKGNRTLNVMGGIIADSVRVALIGEWADYVFEKDYPLLSPEALAAFIKNNKHLPGIPTAKEVSAEGIQLAELSTKLLEKIEELTLYMLRQQEEINNARKEINALKDYIKKTDTGNK